MRRVPAEWEPQHAIWVAWPHNVETWPNRYEPIPGFFRRLVTLIAECTRVNVIGNESLRHAARIDHLDRVRWIPVDTNDCWIRDYGPIFVVDARERSYAIDWRYNAWGGKYPPWDDDDRATATIIEQAGWTRVPGNLCLEGGALEWDGNGRLLTTTRCLVTETRNPGVSKADVESLLRDVAGASEIVWVDGGGLAGDDTDGHIDQLARFIDAENIVVATCDASDAENHAGLESNLKLLRRWARSTQPRVSVHPLPIPPPRRIDRQRVPESYCNFLHVGQDRILVPTFGAAEHDAYALELLARLVRARSSRTEVIGVDCRDLVWGLGAIHCATCHEPKR